MGVLFKFFIIFFFIYLALKTIVAFFIPKKNSGGPKRYNTQRRTSENKSNLSQEERILEYHKKRFDSSNVEDADFVEIKGKEPNNKE
ncbi:MAG: hypothetical protein ACOYEA_04590 [Fermentimonas sp.]|jgi:hypothetical protein